MNETVAVTMRVDRDLKIEAQELFSQLGLDMSTAFNIFLRQAVRTRSIPFEITLGPPDSDFIPVNRRALEFLAREYNEARARNEKDGDNLSEEEMLEKHGVDL